MSSQTLSLNLESKLMIGHLSESRGFLLTILLLFCRFTTKKPMRPFKSVDFFRTDSVPSALSEIALPIRVFMEVIPLSDLISVWLELGLI